MKQVALLRGINLGAKHRLPMADLKAIFAAAGGNDVETVIQSGNVVFTAPNASEVIGRVEAEILARFGFAAPCVGRTGNELRRFLERAPFQGDRLFGGFLRDVPEPDRLALLDPSRGSPDEYVVAGSDVYFNLLTGAATTKLTTAYFDSKLKTTMTVRNWNTIHTLAEMAQ